MDMPPNRQVEFTFTFTPSGTARSMPPKMADTRMAASFSITAWRKSHFSPPKVAVNSAPSNTCPSKFMSQPEKAAQPTAGSVPFCRMAVRCSSALLPEKPVNTIFSPIRTMTAGTSSFHSTEKDKISRQHSKSSTPMRRPERVPVLSCSVNNPTAHGTIKNSVHQPSKNRLTSANPSAFSANTTPAATNTRPHTIRLIFSCNPTPSLAICLTFVTLYSLFPPLSTEKI